MDELTLQEWAKEIVDCISCRGTGKTDDKACMACEEREAGVGDGGRVRDSVHAALRSTATGILEIVQKHDADEEDERGCRCGHDRKAHDFRYEDAEPCSGEECFCASYRPRDIPFKIREQVGLEAE